MNTSILTMIIVKIVKEPRLAITLARQRALTRAAYAFPTSVRTSLFFCAYELHPQMYVSR